MDGQQGRSRSVLGRAAPSRTATEATPSKEGGAMKRAAIYVRVSDESQVDGHSLDFQLADCNGQAEKDGFTVSEEHVYRDEGISATDALKRHAFQRMIADSKANPKPFERIYVWKSDRFARNREDAVVYKGLLRRAGVELVFVKEPIDSESPAGVLLEGMMEVVAKWYSVDLKQKVSRSRQRRIELGLANGDPPMGYARNPQTSEERPLPWIVVENEAAAVRETFERYATGNYAMPELADWLTSQGFVTRNKRASEEAKAKGWIIGPAAFTKDSVKDMLKNPLYY
jgi:DNA invertase Pin-like site-specific DNA recombinase